MSSNRLLSLPLLLLALAACGDSGGPADPGDEPDPEVDLDPTADPTADDFCGRLGWYCTPSEAPPGVLERSDTLLAAVKARVEGGESNTAAAAWLRTQRGVADVDATEAAVVFRVEGAPPTWLLTPRYSPGATPTPPAVTAEQDVVGRGTGRENDERKKKALVLAPYLFQFGGNDPSPTIRSILQGNRDYNHAGGMRYVSNASAPGAPSSGSSTGAPKVADFTGWEAYDAIVISTHGAEMGAQSFGCSFFSDFLTCVAAVSTGERVTGCADAKALYPDTPGIRCGASSGVTGTFILLDTDFFAGQYSVFSPGLDKSIIFFGGCQTFKNSSLAFNLAGSRSEFFGWDDSVYIDEMAAPAIRLFQLMVRDGFTSKAAFDRLKSEGAHSTTAADLDLRSNGDGLHIREIATLKNPLDGSVSGAAPPAWLHSFGDAGPSRAEGDLEAGDLLPFIGQPEDGEDDELFVYVDVDGVRPGDEDDVDLVIEVDGQQKGTWALEGEHARRIDDSTVRLRIREDLGFDVQKGQSIEVKAKAMLPSEGESEQKLTIVLQNPVLHVESMISSEAQTEEGPFRLTSRVEAEIDLSLEQDDDPDELRLGSSIGELRYVEFDLEIPTPAGCTIVPTTFDGRLEVTEGEVELDPEASDFGVPEELLLRVYPEIREELLYACANGAFSQDFIHWFAGFLSFHGGQIPGSADEYDPSRDALVIRNWNRGSGGTYARREYDRSGTSEEVTFREETLLEIRGPEYRTAAPRLAGVSSSAGGGSPPRR